LRNGTRIAFIKFHNENHPFNELNQSYRPDVIRIKTT
jgi:hypothetical protein